MPALFGGNDPSNPDSRRRREQIYCYLPLSEVWHGYPTRIRCTPLRRQALSGEQRALATVLPSNGLETCASIKGGTVTCEDEIGPGGSFNIGARACAEAVPDGYTICILPSDSFTFNQFLFKSLAYDPASFVPITQLFRIVFVVSRALNVDSVSELIALSKEKAGTLSYTTVQRLLRTHQARDRRGHCKGAVPRRRRRP